MKALFRILGTAAAVAVTGAAIVVLDKILNDKAPLHVEEIEFPEDAENDAEEAAKTAQAYAEGETKAGGEAKAEGEAKVESEAKAEAPNPNPVEVGPAVAPKDENGKFDPTKIAEASDFGDWEEQGCKG
jgi:hypothetical protein